MKRKETKARSIKRAVITGPTGAIGTALCRLLAERGIATFALVRPGSARSDHLRKIDGVTVLACDAAELGKLPGMIPSADAFFHLAWAKTTGAGRNDMDAQIRNVQYTMDAVKAASELGCSVFVGAGSQAEYGRVDGALTASTPCFPESGYGIAKLCAGQMSRIECEKRGIDHIWPRILSVYGPCDGENALIPMLIRKLLAGEAMPLTAGTQLWDYLYADDAGEALYRLALLGKAGAVYPVGGGRARPLREYLEILRDAIDPSLPLGLGEIPYGDRQVMHLEADLTDLREDTGFAVKTEFADGIRKTIAWVAEK